MTDLIKRIKKIFIKAKTHLAVDIRYVYRKARFNLNLGSHGNARKKTVKSIPDYTLRVFLSRSLSEIDDIIRNDKPLCDLALQEGERAYNNEWLILNSYHKDMFDKEAGHYRWTEDFLTGYRFKNCFYMDVRKQKTLPGTDIKLPWETARMQCLFALALAYRATKNEKYVEKIKDIINDFNVCCPIDNGVNWNVSMEAGIRISNIVLACELISDSPLFDEDFRLVLATTVCEHSIHIRKNMENERDGGNHLIADILGLAVSSAAAPFLPTAARCAAYAREMIRRELMRQVLPDGGHFEGSVSYHRLVGEMLCFSVIALEKSGFELTDREKERLSKMGEFTYGLRMADGLVPQIGDNDSGRVFQFTAENTRNHDSFINLVSYLTKKTVVFSGNRDAFFCFYGNDAVTDPLLYRRSAVSEYPHTRLLIYDNNGVFLAFSGITPDRFNKQGHAHNDVLSFILSVDGEEMITDPGSGEYTGNAELRRLMRSVQSHSTVSVDGGQQRIPPAGQFRPFQWMSAVTLSSISYKEDNGKIRFEGECRYVNETGKTIVQNRIILFDWDTVIVRDSVDGMTGECSIYLPVFPGIAVKVAENSVILQGKKHRLTISGSYCFSVDKSVFAVQYKQTVPCTVVKCSSGSSRNTLKLKIGSI